MPILSIGIGGIFKDAPNTNTTAVNTIFFISNTSFLSINAFAIIYTNLYGWDLLYSIDTALYCTQGTD